MSDAPPDPLSVQAQLQPERPAVVEGDVAVGYAEFNRRVNRLASGLAALGLRAGERAVWCGPNSTEVMTFIHGARKAGLISVPLAYRFTPDEMQYVIDNSDAALVVVDAEQAPKVAEVRDRLSKVREIVVFRGEPFVGARAWDDVLALGSDHDPGPVGDVGSTMIYTSGTTGKPKGALRTQTDPALVLALLQEIRLVPGQEVHVTTGPLYHSGPLAWAVLAHALGGTVVIMRKFDAAEWVRLVTHHRVTSTFSAPTQLKRIVSLPDDVLAKGDFSSMRSLVANAAPVPYALKQEVIAKLGDGFLFEVYGSTELGVDTVLPPEDQLRKPGSSGCTRTCECFRRSVSSAPPGAGTVTRPPDSKNCTRPSARPSTRSSRSSARRWRWTVTTAPTSSSRSCSTASGSRSATLPMSTTRATSTSATARRT